ncbi:MAG: hypothetical protein ACYTFI_23995, partial [Planctomycetota bacterium]|jgi:hypothetical protein
MIPSLGLYRVSDSDVSFTAPYVSFDLGVVAASIVTQGRGDADWLPIFKPLIGRYHWSESPEDAGLLTGLRVGAMVRLAKPRRLFTDLFLAFEYGWLKAHDAVGDHDARFQTATVGIFLFIPLIGQFD